MPEAHSAFVPAARRVRRDHRGHWISESGEDGSFHRAEQYHGFEFQARRPTVGEALQIVAKRRRSKTTTGRSIFSGRPRIEDTSAGRPQFHIVGRTIPGFLMLVCFGRGGGKQSNQLHRSYASFSGQGAVQRRSRSMASITTTPSENQNRQGVNISTIKEFQVLTNAYSRNRARGWCGRAGA